MCIRDRYGETDNDDIGVDVEAVKEGISDISQSDTAAMEKTANEVSKQYDAEMEEAKKDNDNIPNDLKDMQKYYSLNKVFKEQAEGIVLPMFVKKITTSNIFDANGEMCIRDRVWERINRLTGYYAQVKQIFEAFLLVLNK